MDRQEHLDWCKRRALAHCDAGNLTMAFASFASDLSKHPMTENQPAIQLGLMLMLGGHLNTAQKMRDFITGTN